MRLARSTYYAGKPADRGKVRLVERIKEICAEWPSYGYRRVTAELRSTGWRVNHKKVMRLMREHELTIHPRKRLRPLPTAITMGRSSRTWRRTLCRQDQTSFGSPTSPISPSRPASSIWQPFSMPGRAAWLGYAISRRVDARLALAALKAAIAGRQPPIGCIHHSDRGSQYAAEDYRAELEKHDLRGSMGRRGNPYDNAKAESFMRR
jgi:putative transposase